VSAVVLHDGAIHPGGAVDVVLHAANVLDADLVVGFSGRDRSWWEQRTPNSVRILSQRTRPEQLRDVWLSWKWLNLDLEAYDLVFSSGPATKFYQPYDGQHHLHYLHHPPLSALWFDGGLFDYIVRTVDRIETWSIQSIIANSELTADRMESHYSMDADAVLPPPVEVDRFDPGAEKTANEVVMVGRLEERKRPRTALEAFRRLSTQQNPPQLRVLGDGPLKEELESNAPSNVSFEGYVTDERVAAAVETAQAGLFLARREDFGITPVEYLAGGTPVVAVDEPNTNNQITDGVTGALVKPTPDAVADGVERVLETSWDRNQIRSAADQYSVAAFETGLQTILKNVR